jgi:acetate kinase
MIVNRATDAVVRVPIAVSARHAHLSRLTLDELFGPGYELQIGKRLSQTGQFSAQESVTLIGPRGRLENVRLMGPPRSADQIELSRSDEIALGIDAPLRISGDLTGTPGITLEGPAGRMVLAGGVITAKRHIHAGTYEAQQLGLKDGQTVAVRVDSNGRDMIFGDVMVRVAPDFHFELHLDTDEANAAGIRNGDHGELLTTRL